MDFLLFGDGLEVYWLISPCTLISCVAIHCAVFREGERLWFGDLNSGVCHLTHHATPPLGCLLNDAQQAATAKSAFYYLWQIR